MHVGVRERRPPLSPKDGWISDGRQVLHFKPLLYDRWSQALEVTLGELITREQAIKLWVKKRQQGWQTCTSQWIPPQTPRG
ncbi:MAG: hypothetical protein R6W06_06555 [Prochlorococcaceae cyanobacterium]